MSQPVSQIKPTFAGGEFAPSLHYRVDLQRYMSGCKTLKNCIVHPHGGASNRAGTFFVSATKYNDKKCRGVPFEFSTEQAYSIEFGEYYCRFYMDGGQIVAPDTVSAWASGVAYRIGDFVVVATVVYRCKVANTSNGTTHNTPPGNTTDWEASIIYEIATPYAEADLADLQFTQSADVLYITSPIHAPKTISRYSHIDWRLEAYDFEEGPFMIQNTDSTITITPSAVTGTAITLTASSAIFNALHVGALFRLDHYIPGQAVSAALASVTATTSIKCFSTWRIITHGTWTGKIVVEKSTNGGSTWTAIRQFTSANDYNPNTYGTETDDAPFLVRVNATVLSSGTCNVDLTTDAYTQIGVAKITAYTSGTVVTATVTKEIGLAAATADWAEGAWSDYRGYPKTCTFYQDRLVFASTRSQPQDNWTTKTSNYVNFGRSSPLVASDGISVPLPSRKMNGIENLVPLGKILALTSSSEWSIGPGSDGVFSPTSVEQNLEGYRGCNGVTPVVIGNRVIFIQPMGSIVRDMAYDFSSNSYDGDALSTLSNHLFQGHTIIDMAYQQEPDSIIWMVRDDGIILSLTYLKEQEVIAWTWGDTGEGEGKFESAWTVPGDGYNEVWFVVKRGTKRFIERMAPRMVSTDPRDQYFVDCGLSYDEPITLTGISQANGAVVAADGHGLSNGDIVEVYDVVGMMTTDDAGASVSGLNNIKFKVASAAANTFVLTGQDDDVPLDSRLFSDYVSGGLIRKAVIGVSGLDHLEGRTVAILADGNVLPQQVVTGGVVTITPASCIVHIGLPYVSEVEPLNIDLTLASGSSQGKKVKIPKVMIAFLNSRGGWIGPDRDNLDELEQREAEALGSPIALFTDEYPQVINSQWKSGNSFVFRQVDPLPFTILAFVPVISVGG